MVATSMGHLQIILLCNNVEEDVGLSVGAAWIAGQDRSMWRTLRPSAGQAQQWVSEWVTMWTICWGSLHDGSWTRDLSIRHCNLILCTFLLLLRRRICDCVAEGKPAIIPYARTAAYFKPVLAVSQVEFKPARTASIHITMSSAVVSQVWQVLSRAWLTERPELAPVVLMPRCALLSDNQPWRLQCSRFYPPLR